MTGLIYAVIVGLWAAVLVPMWLRKHDASTETRSVDRFSTAMRSLSRRTPPDAGRSSRQVLMPARSNRPVVSGGRAPSTVARRVEAERQAALRRRRTGLAALGGLLAVVLAAWVLGAAPLWVPLVSVVVALGYLRFLRVEAVRAQQLARRERRRARSMPPVSAPARVGDEVPPRWPVTAPARAAAPAAPSSDAWEPVEVVLPTYVTAPPATSVPRRIDLTHPGSWSAARMLEHAARRPDPDEVFDARVEHEELLDAVAPSDDELFDQTVAAASAPVAGGSAPAPDAVFDQEDEELFGYLERRAVND